MSAPKDASGTAGDRVELIDIARILHAIPHRYPFLMIDRVINLVRDRSAIGVKNVSINEGFFQGHFPNHPVMPGVLIIEALAQLGAILLLRRSPGAIAYFAGIEKARFKKKVVPGDRLDMEVKVLRDRGKFAMIEACAQVDGQVAAEAVLMCMAG